MERQYYGDSEEALQLRRRTRFVFFAIMAVQAANLVLVLVPDA